MPTRTESQSFEDILEHLRVMRGFDFTAYKRASLMRRVVTRMHTVEIATFEGYLDYLQVHQEEFEALFNTILINVTSFFRDPDVWDHMKADVIPRLLADRPSASPIRVWSAGCASGQEAYSIAMLLAERLGLEHLAERVKIYATDVDHEALTQARHASYAARQIEDVPPPLAEKYFDASGAKNFVINRDLRRAVIFGAIDLIQDAPISRIDLLLCRNTLMYFNAEAQARILSRFAFSLNPNGVLLLGRAEMLFSHSTLFVPLDLKRRLFRVCAKPSPRVRPGRPVEARETMVEPMPEEARLRHAAFDAEPVAQIVLDGSAVLVAANTRARHQFGISSRDIGRPLQDLEVSARDGRLAALPRFGEKTALRILNGIADLRATGAYVLWQHGQAEALRILHEVRAHADVLQVEIAGSIRRRMELVRDIDLVAAVRGSPSVVAASLAQMRGVREVLGGGGRALTLRFDDGVSVDLVCVRPEQMALALWRATGSAVHVRQVTERAAALGLVLAGDELRGADGALLPVLHERDLYTHLGLAYCEPELREGTGEVEAALQSALPTLVTESALAGALHCHSQYSDGGSGIAEMADAARARGLTYLGVSDHSQSNTLAGGLSRDDIIAQHQEIDALNAQFVRQGITFRLLKGIEADILPCGRLDYDELFLARFDFVIGSIHTRYGMNERQMTDRVLKALDNPYLTILGHPTGRLLLAREAYAIDIRAVIEKAAIVGVAVELNADPHRLDIDWRACRIAAECGTMVSIGPDAHSPQGFDNLAMGVAIARKGWLSTSQVLNTRSTADILAFALARRDVGRRRHGQQ